MSELEIDLEIAESEQEIDMNISQVVNIGGTDDYSKLKNKPKINGTILEENYDEIDPTVPAWAKESTKPTYTPNEIGALDENNEMTYADIKSVWDSVFTEG